MKLAKLNIDGKTKWYFDQPSELVEYKEFYESYFKDCGWEYDEDFKDWYTTDENEAHAFEFIMNGGGLK